MGPEGKMSWGSKVSAPIFFHPDQKTGQVFKTETFERSGKKSLATSASISKSTAMVCFCRIRRVLI